MLHAGYSFGQLCAAGPTVHSHPHCTTDYDAQQAVMAQSSRNGPGLFAARAAASVHPRVEPRLQFHPAIRTQPRPKAHSRSCSHHSHSRFPHSTVNKDKGQLGCVANKGVTGEIGRDLSGGQLPHGRDKTVPSSPPGNYGRIINRLVLREFPTAIVESTVFTLLRSLAFF
jgi:hypothetical protein